MTNDVHPIITDIIKFISLLIYDKSVLGPLGDALTCIIKTNEIK